MLWPLHQVHELQATTLVDCKNVHDVDSYVILRNTAVILIYMCVVLTRTRTTASVQVGLLVYVTHEEPGSVAAWLLPGCSP